MTCRACGIFKENGAMEVAWSEQLQRASQVACELSHLVVKLRGGVD